MGIPRTNISTSLKRGGGELYGKIYRYAEDVSNVEPTTEDAPVVDPIVSNAIEENALPLLPSVVEYIALEPTGADEHERDVS